MKVAVLGASGMIGQQFVRLLADHPMFEIEHLYASDRSAGKSMQDIWRLPFFDCPSSVKDKKIEELTEFDSDVPIAFSGLPKSIAYDLEIELRDKGIAVFSNAGSHRMDQDVPILIPEINGEHVQLIDTQRDRYNTNGFIVTNSNCSATGSSVYLAELSKLVDIKTAVVSTYQALSGAGIGGVSALDISGNVIPYIGNEEPKIIEETKKIIGRFTEDKIEDHPVNVIANAARVNVIDGHLEAITCLFDDQLPETLISDLSSIKSPLNIDKYHIAPETHFHVFEEADRPQPRLDVFRSDQRETTMGMTVHAGRLRQQKYDLSAYVLVHNTIRGGAGGSVLNAEYAKQEGYL